MDKAILTVKLAVHGEGVAAVRDVLEYFIQKLQKDGDLAGGELSPPAAMSMKTALKGAELLALRLEQCRPDQINSDD